MELMARAELCSVRACEARDTVGNAANLKLLSEDPPPGRVCTPMSPVRSATPLVGTKQRSARFCAGMHTPARVLACSGGSQQSCCHGAIRDQVWAQGPLVVAAAAMILSDARYSLRWIVRLQGVAIVVQDTATRYATTTPCTAVCAASVCQQSDVCVKTHLWVFAVGCGVQPEVPRRPGFYPPCALVALATACFARTMRAVYPSPVPHLPCARVALATGCSSALLLSTPEAVAGNGGRTHKAPASLRRA